MGQNPISLPLKTQPYAFLSSLLNGQVLVSVNTAVKPFYFFKFFSTYKVGTNFESTITDFFCNVEKSFCLLC